MELNDDVLSEYVFLSREIREQSKRLDAIRQECKARGTFATARYVCLVESSSRQGLPGLEEVMKCIRRETLEILGLLRTIPIVSVKVINKEDVHIETVKN